MQINRINLALIAAAIAGVVLFGPGVRSTVGEMPADQRDMAPAAIDLLPLRQAKGEFAIVEGDEKGQRVPFQLYEQDGMWVLDKEGRMRHFLNLDDDGNIVVIQEENHSENATMEYDPPMILIPNQAKLGDPISRQSAVVVRDVDSGRVKYRGECNYQVTIDNSRAVQTPAGQFDTYVVKSRRTVDLGVVSISLQLDFGYASGTGQVTESVRQKTSAMLGLYRTSESWRSELNVIQIGG